MHGMGEHASQAGRAGDAENASDRVSAEGAGATDRSTQEDIYHCTYIARRKAGGYHEQKLGGGEQSQARRRRVRSDI